MKYCVFETNWGYFGLAGTQDKLCLTQLPGPDARKVEELLLRDLAVVGGRLSRSSRRSSVELEVQSDSAYFEELQQQIVAYFDRERVVFGGEIPLSFGGVSDFGRAVLGACRQVGFGQTMTYSTLAGRAGRPKASRAVGGVMASNPMPLIIPCHRILRSDGGLGGFSAPGGVEVKRRLLEHERRCAG